jgi:hypothetical protein
LTLNRASARLQSTSALEALFVTAVKNNFLKEKTMKDMEFKSSFQNAADAAGHAALAAAAIVGVVALNHDPGFMVSQLGPAFGAAVNLGACGLLGYAAGGSVMDSIASTAHAFLNRRI